MSVITEVVLFAGEWEHHPSTEPHVTQTMLEWVPAEADECFACRQGLRLLTKGGDRDDLDEVPDIWGGEKVSTGNVYGAAFNYLRWDRFKAWLEGLPWRYPEYVRVLVSGEGDRAFALWAFTWPAPGFLPLQEPDLGLAQEEGASAELVEKAASLMVEHRKRYGLRPERFTLIRIYPFDGARS